MGGGGGVKMEVERLLGIYYSNPDGRRAWPDGQQKWR